MDNHGIDRRHINAGFNNRGGKQQISFAVGKIVHHLFQMFDRHLPVRHQNFYIGNQLPQLFFHTENVRYPRTNEECLPVAEFFAVDGFFYHHLVKRHHKRSGCQAVNRRRADDTQLFNPGQGHLQRTGNRRCRQRQDMNV